MAKKEDSKVDDSNEPAEAVASTEGLVKVKKADEVLHVHPNALTEHERLGWKAVE